MEAVSSIHNSKTRHAVVAGIHLTLLVVVYGCETWSLILREEHRLRVFENRVLIGIFGPKREEVVGSWRKLHNEELHNFYASPNIITVIKSWRMRWAGHVRRKREMKNAYKVWSENQKEGDHLEDLGVNERIILRGS
jgi:hypothetical protein